MGEGRQERQADKQMIAHREPPPQHRAQALVQARPARLQAPRGVGPVAVVADAQRAQVADRGDHLKLVDGALGGGVGVVWARGWGLAGVGVSGGGG
jgi:hypothetical protein